MTSEYVRKCHTLECRNLVYDRYIFCRECFQFAGSAARTRWRIAFPYPTGYADAVHHPDQRSAIVEMEKAVKLGRSQIRLFDTLPI